MSKLSKILSNKKIKLAIFASGTGSNADAIIRYSTNSNYEVSMIVSNNKDAGVLGFSNQYNIDALVIDKESFYKEDKIIDFLKEKDINLIILAGFLWLIPPYFIQAFENKIINIHPSLLPKYGGKNMYGSKVHKAVLAAKEKESGITIHLVNEFYDKGQILFQKSTDISKDKTIEEIAKRVLKIEHTFYPQVIEKYIENSEF